MHNLTVGEHAGNTAISPSSDSCSVNTDMMLISILALAKINQPPYF